MRKILGVAVVVALLAAGTAQAQGPAASGFSLGARVGYGIPMGDADGGDALAGIPAVKLSDVVDGQIPLQVDAMYRFDRNWSIGLYFQYGFAFVSDTYCPPSTGLSCSASNLRFGGQVHYRFDGQGFLPWIGLGIGGEWGTVTGEVLGFSGTILEVSGIEFANLQVGGDWVISPNFRLGPYVQLSFAQYDTVKQIDVNLQLVPVLVSKTTHEWLQFGVKGTFDL